MKKNFTFVFCFAFLGLNFFLPIVHAANSQKDKVETIGEATEPNSHKLFLRQSSVLLKHGEIEAETGVVYQHNQDYITGNRNTARLVTIPLNARVGLLNRLDVFLGMPLSYGQSEAGTVTENDFGIGDIDAGVHFVLFEEKNKFPEIVFSLSGTAPTGKNPYDNAIAFGQGHWAISGNVLFIKSVDPLILFGGLGYTHSFEKNFSIGDVQPGETIGYSLGLGFAVNKNITLNTTLLGNITTESKLNNANIPGSSDEPISLSTGLTYMISKKNYLEPAVIIGLNDSASDVAIRFSAVKRF